MAWDVEFTEEFGEWWETLSLAEQEDVALVVNLLVERGPTLRHPYSSGIARSRFSQMRELRIQHSGRPYRVLYAFDPRRAAILLVGGDKTGNDRWYEIFIPIADRLYERHLEILTLEEQMKPEKDEQKKE